MLTFMLFTSGQLIAALGLSKQQWRTYRKALQPLDRQRGPSPCFTASDLLAVRIVQIVVDRLRAPVSALSSVATPLWNICQHTAWPQLERSQLLVDLMEHQVQLVSGMSALAKVRLGVLVELSPIVFAIREKFVPQNLDNQKHLSFPPMIAGSAQR